MTGPFNSDLLAMVQHMIAASRSTITATGTLTDRYAEIWAGGMCQIDPSAVSVPVKIFRDCDATPGDRVALIKFGSDWAVVGTFGSTFLPVPVSNVFGFGGITGTTSATPTDMPGPPTVTLTKRFDWSWVEVTLFISTFATANGTGMRGGVLVNGVDYDVLNKFHNSASVHASEPGIATITDLPAGDWPISVRWRRSAGSGEIRVDTNDNVHIRVLEVAPPPS